MIHLPGDISKDTHSGLRRNSSQSGSDFANFLVFQNCKVHFPNITNHSELDFAIFHDTHFQKVVIRTEELRRSDSLWDELRPVSPDLQVYLQKHVKPRE